MVWDTDLIGMRIGVKMGEPLVNMLVFAFPHTLRLNANIPKRQGTLKKHHPLNHDSSPRLKEIPPPPIEVQTYLYNYPHMCYACMRSVNFALIVCKTTNGKLSLIVHGDDDVFAHYLAAYLANRLIGWVESKLWKPFGRTSIWVQPLTV